MLQLDPTGAALAVGVTLAVALAVTPLYARNLRSRGKVSIEAVRANPDRWKKRLADVVRVHVGSLADADQESAGHGVVATCFAVTAQGETVDLGRGSDEDRMSADATWLADLLGVPLSNDSVGWAGATQGDGAGSTVARSARARRVAGGLTLLGLAAVALVGAWLALDAPRSSYEAAWGAYIDDLAVFVGDHAALLDAPPGEAERLARPGDAPLADDVGQPPAWASTHVIAPTAPVPPGPARVGFLPVFLGGLGLLGIAAASALLWPRSRSY